MNDRRLGVIGFPVKHSLSPEIHQAFARQFDIRLSYEKFAVEPDKLSDFVKDFFHQGGHGLNVTVPHKQSVISLCDQLTERAEQAQAVNTLWQESGKIFGDNTDGQGFIQDLINHNVSCHNKRILILGAGGATRGIIHPLINAGSKEVVIANRTMTKAEVLVSELALPHVSACALSDIDDFESFDLIINATPMSLAGEQPDLSASLLHASSVIYDLAYERDKPTPFQQWGRDNGVSRALDGLGMLVEQAALAFELWYQMKPESRKVLDGL